MKKFSDNLSLEAKLSDIKSYTVFGSKGSKTLISDRWYGNGRRKVNSFTTVIVKSKVIVRRYLVCREWLSG